MKLTEFQTPFGQRGNIFSLSSWTSVILGTVVLIVGFALGQNVANFIGKKTRLDTQIDPIIAKPPAASTAPAREVY